MSLLDLTRRECEIVHCCIRAVAYSEDFFKDDEEFQTIFGVTRDQFCQIANGWPNLNENNPDVSCVIGNSLNNLLGYPHKRHEEWGKYFDFTPDDLHSVLKKWSRKTIRNYFDGIV